MTRNRKSYEILALHLKKLQKENSKFSIRSVSLKLGTSSAFLTNVLNGKTQLPLRRLASLCEILKIDDFDRNEIKKRLTLEKMQFDEVTENIEPSRSNTHQELLPESQIRILRYWWNLAILELLTCSSKRGLSKKDILERINVSASELDVSLNELMQIKVIRREEDFFFKTEEHFKLPTRGPNPITRNFYKMALKLAQEALDKTEPSDFEQRLITTVSCAVNPAQIPKAKLKLAEALAEIRDILTEGECTQVYFLQAQLFSVLK